MTCCVYLFECRGGRYVGLVEDLRKRLLGLMPGILPWTRTRRPVRLTSFHDCPNRATAVIHEKRLNYSRSRSATIDLMTLDFPEHAGAAFQATARARPLDCARRQRHASPGPLR
jgi:predicted GIY-YIG superfamily endonuclease